MRDPTNLSKKDLVTVIKTIQNEVYFPSGKYGVPADIHQVLARFDLHTMPVKELPVPELVYVETSKTPIVAAIERYTNGYAVASKWLGARKGWTPSRRIPRSRILGPASPNDPEVVNAIAHTWIPSMQKRIIENLKR